MARIAVLAYGTSAYALFLGTFLYLIGFVGNLVVPKSIDSGAGAGTLAAWIVDAGLLGLFALQHSVMARPGFKRRWLRIIPIAIERSTFVLLTNVILWLLFWQWRPIATTLWQVPGGLGTAAVQSIFVVAWIVVLLGTFMTNHFELFGLRQVWLHFRGTPYAPIAFTTRGFYRYVRHPLMVGFLLAFWATPRMTAGHLMFAFTMTAYVLFGIRLEERDLAKVLGKSYEAYRASTPALLPRGRSTRDGARRPRSSRQRHGRIRTEPVGRGI
ncbi:MAG: isoprenylcysteine carboxylmethyltransferase family protein [Deltaproteobacteria bacterium]|nr:isoprenylcysteine carboxylmethyltransferase family protein [Deltaproteobacteria bacterium]